MEQTVNPRAIYQGQSEDSLYSLNNCPELRSGCPKRLFLGVGGSSHPRGSLPYPLFGRLSPAQIIYKLMFTLVLLLRLTYCQSSQVTGMLTAVKKQFVSTKLQLKYYQAAILDWQCSEDLLNSRQLPLAEAGI